MRSGAWNPEEDDEQLMLKVARGDETSLGKLYDRYAPTAVGVAYKVCGDRNLAEDAVQEAFLALWRRAASYEPAKGSVPGYIYGAVHHKAVDTVRKEESKRKRDALDAFQQTSPAAEVEDAATASIDRDRVRFALQSLSAHQRQVLELAYFGGLSYPEVARKLEIPLGTAKTRIRDGMIRLRTLLTEESAEEQV
jgi:RNA polymerase sigma-70 factor (ECF subfamily)